ncbi:hypothetical protein Tco_1286408 [Tanacetum coccineum]
MLVEGSRRRGRPKLRWEDRLKQDMMELLLSVDMTSDRNAWRDRIRISGSSCLVVSALEPPFALPVYNENETATGQKFNSKPHALTYLGIMDRNF